MTARFLSNFNEKRPVIDRPYRRHRMLMAPISPLPAAKTKKPPVSETIRKIGSGANSGEMDITLMKFPGAVADEVRCGVPGAGCVFRRIPEWIPK